METEQRYGLVTFEVVKSATQAIGRAREMIVRIPYVRPRAQRQVDATLRMAGHVATRIKVVRKRARKPLRTPFKRTPPTKTRRGKREHPLRKTVGRNNFLDSFAPDGKADIVTLRALAFMKGECSGFHWD